jgi:hypothetical protein
MTASGSVCAGPAAGGGIPCRWQWARDGLRHTVHPLLRTPWRTTGLAALPRGTRQIRLPCSSRFRLRLLQNSAAGPARVSRRLRHGGGVAGHAEGQAVVNKPAAERVPLTRDHEMQCLAAGHAWQCTPGRSYHGRMDTAKPARARRAAITAGIIAAVMAAGYAYFSYRLSPVPFLRNGGKSR